MKLFNAYNHHKSRNQLNIGIIATTRIYFEKYEFHIFSKFLNLDNNLVQRSANENSYPPNSPNCDKDLVLLGLVRGVASS